jgi:hypothetical protein
MFETRREVSRSTVTRATDVHRSGRHQATV